MACYDGVGERCSGKAQRGAVAMKEFAVAKWELPLVGIYNCRPARQGTSLSTHGEGRGIDLHVHVRCSECEPTPEERRLGQEIANFMVEHSEALGIQRVIWLNLSWNSGTGKWWPYNGPYHGNHVHVELCWSSALNNTLDTYRSVSSEQELDLLPNESEALGRIDVRVAALTEKADATLAAATKLIATSAGILAAVTQLPAVVGGTIDAASLQEVVEDAVRETLGSLDNE